jgi:hypothetical protein
VKDQLDSHSHHENKYALDENINVSLCSPNETEKSKDGRRHDEVIVMIHDQLLILNFSQASRMLENKIEFMIAIAVMTMMPTWTGAPSINSKPNVIDQMQKMSPDMTAEKATTLCFIVINVEYSF